jgi:hypothetical protein
VNAVARCADVATSEESRCAIIWILGAYGAAIDDGPYILENIVDMLTDTTVAPPSGVPTSLVAPPSAVLASLLTAVNKMLVKRPGECQDLAGRVLEMCARSDDVDLQYRAAVYYRLLDTDIGLAANTLHPTQPLSHNS